MNNSFTLRRAEIKDVKEVNELVSNTGGISIYKATFGSVNFTSIIESSYVSIFAAKCTNLIEHCSGFISVNDGLPSIVMDAEFYDTIFEVLPNFIPATSSNTNFINGWLLDEELQNFEELGKGMIKKVFSICSNVDYLLWICPKNFIPSKYVEKNFSNINFDSKYDEMKDFKSKLNGLKLLFVHRSKFLTKLLVREARVEDNDDLIPILQNFNPDILAGQESFFLADLIESQDEKNKFYVGLSQNLIVGMLATSQDINVSLITKIFNIDSYSDIIIQKKENSLPPPLLIAVIGDIRLLNLDTAMYTINSLNCLFINGEVSNSLDISNAVDSKTNDGSPLQSYLQNLSSGYDLNSHSGIVFLAYPVIEVEEQLQDICDKFDYIIELINSNENAEEDDDDLFLQHHLDAVEVLKEFYFQQEGKKENNKISSNSNYPKANWRKLMIDGEIVSSIDAVQLLRSDMTTILDDRIVQIEQQKIKDREEPAKANAFAITVFCLNEDYLSRGQDMIKVAFEDHPQLEYCLYMVANIPVPPVELMGYLTYVQTRANISFDQSLYIMHRSAFLVNEHMKLFRLNNSLFPNLKQFAISLQQTEQAMLLSCARSSLNESDVHLRDNPLETCFLINIGSVVIGSVVLSRRTLSNDDLQWIRANFHIDEFVDFDIHRIRNQSFITKWYLDPLYSFCTRRILQHIMRLCNKILLYFQADLDITPPTELINELLVLKPRKRVQAVGGLKAEFLTRPSAENGGLSSECPLYFMTKHLLSKSKTITPKRVVVIGGSSHSYALLETLISVPYLILPNIYIVIDTIPPPLIQNEQYLSEEEETKNDGEYSGCLSIQDEQYPSEIYLNALGLGFKVKVIRGHLTDIDREHRAIVISNEMALEYDILVLSSSTQDNSIKEIPSLVRMHPARCADSGIFSLGNPTSDAIAMKYVKKRYPARTDDVIVYGSGLAALTAVSKLLQIGLAPNRITYVVPEEEGVIDISLDKNVSTVILNNLLSTGVKICWGYTIAEVHLAHTGFLSSVEVKKKLSSSNIEETKSETKNPIDKPTDDSSLHDGESGIMLACLALLCCSVQKCDRDVFCAINDCGLVFDGGLVVDSDFCTVDKSIYAVSNYTRFSRVYKNALPHHSFNSREMGSFVASKILEQHLDPFTSQSPTSNYRTTSRGDISISFVKKQSKNLPTPRFVLPKAISCELPGNLYFFSCAIPHISSEIIDYFTNNPSTATNTLTSNRNCLLKTDYFGNVVEFTYVGEDRVEKLNLSLIPGIHESYLNSAVHSYTQGNVLDWISFFRQSWANAFYQDYFPVLIKSVRKNLEADKGMIMILNRVYEKSETIQDDQEIAVFRREFLGSNGELIPENTYKTIEADTLDYLKDNRALLPSYYLVSGNVQKSNKF